MNEAQLETIRVHAITLRSIQQGMTQEEFVQAVVDYAHEQIGQHPEIDMMAARLARHAWDSYRPN